MTVNDRQEPVEVETCDRCAGNGEIVTDWDRYLHPHEGDVGDEAVAVCPIAGAMIPRAPADGQSDAQSNPRLT